MSAALVAMKLLDLGSLPCAALRLESIFARLGRGCKQI